MSIWDSLRKLLGRKPYPSSTITDKQTTSTAPTSSGSTSTDLPDSDLPNPGDTPVDLIRLLFNRKDKHQTTMLNSISLSTDMKTLYLIDNGRAIPFDLTVPEGVLVGLLGKQLVVATGISVPSPDGPVLEGGGGGEKPRIETGGIKPEKAATTYSFKTGKDSQYTVSYNGENQAFGIIGTDNVVIHLEAPTNGGCEKHYFDLTGKGIIRLNRLEDELQITEVK